MSNISTKLIGILSILLVNNKQCDGIGQFEINIKNLLLTPF